VGAVPAHVLRGSIRLGVESNATECIFRQAWLRPGLTATQQPLVAGGEHLRRCDCSSRVCVAQPVAGSRNGGNFYTESQLPPGAQPATEASSPELRPPPSPPPYYYYREMAFRPLRHVARRTRVAHVELAARGAVQHARPPKVNARTVAAVAVVVPAIVGVQST
jgi:hypothetical protein